MKHLTIFITCFYLSQALYAQTRVGTSGTPNATLDVQNGGGSFNFWSTLPAMKVNKLKFYMNTESFNNVSTTNINLNSGNSMGNAGMIDFFLNTPAGSGASTSFTVYMGIQNGVAYHFTAVGGAGATITQSGSSFTIAFAGGTSYVLAFGAGSGNAVLRAQSGTISGNTTISYLVKAIE